MLGPVPGGAWASNGGRCVPGGRLVRDKRLVQCRPDLLAARSRVLPRRRLRRPALRARGTSKPHRRYMCDTFTSRRLTSGSLAGSGSQRAGLTVHLMPSTSNHLRWTRKEHLQWGRTNSYNQPSPSPPLETIQFNGFIFISGQSYLTLPYYLQGGVFRVCHAAPAL